MTKLVLVSTVRVFWSGVRPERRVAWSVAEGWHTPDAAEWPAVFVRSMRADGFDHGVDGTLPRSAGDWPWWLILGLRPWFAWSVDPAVRLLGVAAFRAGFYAGRAEREGARR